VTPTDRPRRGRSGARTRQVAKPQADCMLDLSPKDGHHRYQFFPDLPPDQFEALKADIAKRGQLEPIDVDERGEVLAGHQRLRAIEELGVEPQFAIRAGLTEAEKIEHAIKSNVLRRHLGPIEKARALERLAELEGATLGTRGGPARDRRTVRRLAELFGADRSTAYRWIETARKLEPHPDLARLVDAGAMEARRAVALAREREAAARAAPASSRLPASADLRLGDFREVLADVPEGSAELIFTDPPWTGPSMPIFSDLGRFAARALKPSGLLLCEVGQMHMAEAIRLLGSHLTYLWCLALWLPGRNARIQARQAINTWRPILVYSRTQERRSRWFLDSYRVEEPPDKTWHPWQKAVAPARYYIDQLTGLGDLVVDPFLGSGSTALAAVAMDRRFVGSDIDPKAIHATRVRLADLGAA
jgi:hypothetical protein